MTLSAHFPRGDAFRSSLCGFFHLLLSLTTLPLAYAVDAGDGNPPAPFWRDAELKGNAFYFHRHRERYQIETGQYENLLHHSTLQTNLEFSSGLIEETAGVDLAWFATTDVENTGLPVHEISFFPWRDPWSPDPTQEDARSGGSLYRAHLRLRHSGAWAKLGYFQPSGPGVLGVNWSLLPGTYRGVEGGGQIGALSLAAAYVTGYKAPWFQDVYAFRQNDGATAVDFLWSAGARYAFSPALSAELAWGGSENYLRNAHLKIRLDQLADAALPFYLSYQLYAMADSDNAAPVNDNFSGTAWQHYLAAQYRPGSWSLRAEFLHTRAPMDRPENVGYFAYRLTSAYGGSNGAYEPWWDTRSDWNHHKESALFADVSRTFGDIGLPGWSAGLSFARGWGGRAYGYSGTLREHAYAIDLGYAVASGPLKGARAALHYIRYDNETSLPSWTVFRNAFQDERDIKFIVTLPWNS